MEVFGATEKQVLLILFAKCGDEKRYQDCALLEGRCTTTASKGFVLNSEENYTTTKSNLKDCF